MPLYDSYLLGLGRSWIGLLSHDKIATFFMVIIIIFVLVTSFCYHFDNHHRTAPQK